MEKIIIRLNVNGAVVNLNFKKKIANYLLLIIVNIWVSIVLNVAVN